MKLVYTHENKLLVENAKNILNTEGIDCVLRNEYASGGAGDLAPTEAWPEVWVLNEADEARAKKIVDELREEPEGESWVCSECGEENEPTFASCWQCQTEKP